MAIRVGVLTVSDRCSQGLFEDQSGPAIAKYLRDHLGAPVEIELGTVADEAGEIQKSVLAFCESKCSVVITTGGTGFGTRDVTPEAVKILLEKEASGIVHAILNASLKATPFAWLSRPVAGVRGNTIIMTLPGSPKAVTECLEPIVSNGLRHAIELAGGESSDHPVKSGCTGACGRTALHLAGGADDANGVGVAARPRVSQFEMVPVDVALELIANAAPLPKRTTLERNELVGSEVPRVLATDVVATFPHPPFRASIKDGYAVVSTDGIGVFPVVGSLLAGDDINPHLQPGSIMRVNTGGLVPDGADAVVQVEDTEVVKATSEGEEEMVRICAIAKCGQDIRPVGCDVSVGDVVVRKETQLLPPEIGLIESTATPQVAVYSLPKICVVSTGNELVQGGSGRPAMGKIMDSNKVMLIEAARRHGPTFDGGLALDTMSSTRSVLRDAFNIADVVITTGGVSMGEADCVKRVLDEIGATVRFGRVNMKPGKPTTFATMGEKLFFGLPGNPVSAMVCFHLFVEPALRIMRGVDTKYEKGISQTVQARLLHSVELDPSRPEYHRCVVRWSGAELTASSTGLQASHRLLSMAGANGMLQLPAATNEMSIIEKGALVRVMLIGSLQY